MDCSAQPTKEAARLLLNLTHRSEWIVQGQPTTNAVDGFFESHPREWVGRARPASDDRREGGLERPRHSRGWDWRSTRAAFVCRPDLNDPPTPVGGIREARERRSSVGRT